MTSLPMFLTSVLPQTSRGIAIASVASSLTAHVAGAGIVVWMAAVASNALLDARLTSRPGAALTVTLVTPPVVESVDQPVTVTPTPESHVTPESLSPVEDTSPDDLSATASVSLPSSQQISLDRAPAPPVQFLAVVSPDAVGPKSCEDGSIRERQEVAATAPAQPSANDSVPPRPRTERPAAKPPTASFVAIPVAAGVTSQEGPAFLDNPPPEYPQVALARRWQGEVVVRVWIDAEGRVRRAELDRSSGHDVLDDAALKAVRQWRARPARERGQAVETVQLQPIVFRLERRGT